ncbi:Gfo/Idh/MocA family protein [Desertibaculum subflavum]|uniref:Gfo/Idh/MocA family protein n=1 Tax=Desertibaculum subflavum TaxID=2268458 RepID=UPI000E67425F
MRLGIVGCGLIGEKRALAARGHQIVAVADLDLGKAERLGQKVGAIATADWRNVVQLDLDAIVVATAHDALSPIAVAALEAGRHVLVEKPAGRSLAEVQAVAAAAAASGRLAKVGFNHRFHPALLLAHTMHESGWIGPILYIRGRYGHGGRPGYETEWRCDPAISGGGELVDQGSHLIDLARWFMGELKLDYAHTPTLFWNAAVDDNCFLALRGEGGALAWLHASWTEWKNTFSFEIAGRDGKLTIDGLGGSYGVERLTIHRMLPGMGPPETTIHEYPFPDRSWDEEMQSFALAVEGKGPLVGGIEDAVAMHVIIDQAYRRHMP